MDDEDRACGSPPMGDVNAGGQTGRPSSDTSELTSSDFLSIMELNTLDGINNDASPLNDGMDDGRRSATSCTKVVRSVDNSVVTMGTWVPSANSTLCGGDGMDDGRRSATSCTKVVRSVENSVITTGTFVPLLIRRSVVGVGICSMFSVISSKKYHMARCINLVLLGEPIFVILDSLVWDK